MYLVGVLFKFGPDCALSSAPHQIQGATTFEGVSIGLVELSYLNLFSWLPATLVGPQVLSRESYVSIGWIFLQAYWVESLIISSFFSDFNFSAASPLVEFLFFFVTLPFSIAIVRVMAQ